MSLSYLAYFVPSDHRRVNEFIGLLLATVAILVGLSLISFNPDDPSFNISTNPRFEGKPSNFIGVVGAYLADGFFQVLGYSSFLLPVYLGIYAFYWLASWPVKAIISRAVGMLLMVLTLSTALSITPALPRIGGQLPAGGVLGKLSADNLDALVNPAGSAVVLLAAFFVSLFLTTTFSFEWAMGKLKPRLKVVGSWAERYRQWSEARVVEKERRKAESKKAPKKQVISTPRETATPPLVAESPRPKAIAATAQPPVAMPQASSRASKAKQAPQEPISDLPSTLPSTALLHMPIAVGKIDEAELRQRALSIETRTREFDVEGVVQQIHPGPVVTTFEFKPEPGVK